MNQKEITAGLVGCGAVSKSHLGGYRSAGIRAVALCDVDAERAEKSKRDFEVEGATIYTDYRKMLERDDIDLVSVATPVAFHAPITMDALAAGKHVACEKPSTLSLDENRKIIEAAGKTDRKVIFFSSRYRWGNAELAKRYIDDGEVGDIYRINVQFYRSRGRPGVDIIKHARWFADKKLAGGGIMMDMGQYFMDLSLHLAGWPDVTAASAITYKGFPHDLPEDVVYDVEEHATILARAGKTTIMFDLANISHHKPGLHVTVFGERGGFVLDRGERYFTFCTEKGTGRQIEHTTTWRDNAGANERIYQHLARAIGGEDLEVGTTPTQALTITELTKMAYRSAELGREVKREEL